MDSEYLNSLTYDQARDLYNQHGTSMFLKTLFSKYTPYNHTRLLEELSNLPPYQLTNLPTKKNLPPYQLTNLPTKKNLPPYQLTTLPTFHLTNLPTLINRRRYLYRQSADNHAKLKALFLTNTPVEAKGITADLALAILNNFDEIKNIWDVTTHYDTHNQLPDGITITAEGKIQPTTDNQQPTTDNRQPTTENITQATDLALNTQFQKHYKYITRYKNVPTAAVELANRQSICHAIATELIRRGTFQYPNHNYMLKPNPKP